MFSCKRRQSVCLEAAWEKVALCSDIKPGCSTSHHHQGDTEWLRNCASSIYLKKGKESVIKTLALAWKPGLDLWPLTRWKFAILPSDFIFSLFCRGDGRKTVQIDVKMMDCGREPWRRVKPGGWALKGEWLEHKSGTVRRREQKSALSSGGKQEFKRFAWQPANNWLTSSVCEDEWGQMLSIDVSWGLD